MIKEILTNDNWETREEDVYTICNLLIKESKSLSEEILLLRKALKS